MRIEKTLPEVKSYEFKIITNKDELWNKVAGFAQNCSWRAGKSLAKKMLEDKL